MIDGQFDRTNILFNEMKFKTNLSKLFDKRVIVFGLGGVGGYVVESLIRTGIRKIAIVDKDVITPSNINRQIIANANNIGMKKVDAMEERIKNIDKDIEVEKFNIFYSKETVDEINLKKYDYIIDAIDVVSSKICLIEEANKNNIKIISCMGTGNKIEPEKLLVSDIYETKVCPLAKVLRHELRKRNIKELKVVYSPETPFNSIEEESGRHIPGSAIFVPASAGILIAREVIFSLIS